MKNVYGVVSATAVAQCAKGFVAAWLFGLAVFCSPTYAATLIIPVAQVPCPTCATATDAEAAAQVYFTQWYGATPPGYVGVISNAGSCVSPVPADDTYFLVTTTTVGVSYVYGSCWRYPQGIARLEMLPIPVTSVNQSCLEAYREGIPCSSYLAYLKDGSPVPVPPSPTMPAIGTTPAQVDTNFPAVILWGFQTNPGIDAQITNLPDTDLALLSHLYYMRTNANVVPLLNVAAEKLSVANLLRFKAAFGQAAMDAAVNLYAPNSVKAAYFAAPAPPYIPTSQAHYFALGLNAPTANGLATPNQALNMTPTEIWMDFYTADTATTVFQATVLASTYISANLGAAYSFGYAIGTGVYFTVTYFDPNFFNNLIDFFGAPWMGTTPGGTVTVGQPEPDGFVFHYWQYSGQ